MENLLKISNVDITKSINAIPKLVHVDATIIQGM